MLKSISENENKPTPQPPEGVFDDENFEDDDIFNFFLRQPNTASTINLSQSPEHPPTTAIHHQAPE